MKFNRGQSEERQKKLSQSRSHLFDNFCITKVEINTGDKNKLETIEAKKINFTVIPAKEKFILQSTVDNNW